MLKWLKERPSCPMCRFDLAHQTCQIVFVRCAYDCVAVESTGGYVCPTMLGGYLQISISGNACDIASQSLYHAVFVFSFEEA